MREILFRGKRKDNGEWAYGTYVSQYKTILSKDIDLAANLYPEYTVDISTVGQFTGVTDRSGKKIFEGDILQGEQYPYYSDGEYNYFAEVIWFDNSPAFCLYTFKAPKSDVHGISTGNTDYMENWCSSDWKVIGNIHDNDNQTEH